MMLEGMGRLWWRHPSSVGTKTWESLYLWFKERTCLDMAFNFATSDKYSAAIDHNTHGRYHHHQQLSPLLLLMARQDSTSLVRRRLVKVLTRQGNWSSKHHHRHQFQLHRIQFLPFLISLAISLLTHAALLNQIVDPSLPILTTWCFFICCPSSSYFSQAPPPVAPISASRILIIRDLEN